MRRFGRGLAGAAVGLIGGGALAALVASGAGWLFAISQAEGAYAMQVAFFDFTRVLWPSLENGPDIIRSEKPLLATDATS